MCIHALATMVVVVVQDNASGHARAHAMATLGAIRVFMAGILYVIAVVDITEM